MDTTRVDVIFCEYGDLRSRNSALEVSIGFGRNYASSFQAYPSIVPARFSAIFYQEMDRSREML